MNKNLFYFPPSYWVCQAIGYCLTVVSLFCIPFEKIANYPWTNTFIEIMSRWVPMINGINETTGFTRGIAFYYSVLWVITPTFALVLIGCGAIHPKIRSTVGQRVATPFSSILVGLAFWIICLLVALCWPINHDSYSWRDQMLFRSQLGFSLFGLMTMWVWSLLFGFKYMLIEKLVYSIYKFNFKG